MINITLPNYGILDVSVPSPESHAQSSGHDDDDGSWVAAGLRCLSARQVLVKPIDLYRCASSCRLLGLLLCIHRIVSTYLWKQSQSIRSIHVD